MATAQLAPATQQASLCAPHEATRLAYIDNLRITVIAVVVVHHAAQAYGSAGSGWAIPNPTQSLILRPFLAVNGAFGMGLMFLLAGYFLPHAYDHHGARELLRERSLRLGLPLLLVALGVMLPYTYLTQPPGLPFGAFLPTYLPEPQVGHMWFAGLLLICTWAYAGWRQLARAGGPAAGGGAAAPGHGPIVAFALWLGVTTFLVRLVYPLDRWVSPLPLLWFEPARLPQYLGLFAIGCAAAGPSWFERLPTRIGMLWLKVGLGAAALPYIAALLGPRLPAPLALVPRSGPGLDAILWTLVETLVSVGLCVGLVTLFRERVNRRSALLRQLSAATYAVYVIHLLPVLGLQLALADVALPPLVKFLIVALIAVPLSFWLALLLRRLPGLGRLLG